MSDRPGFWRRQFLLPPTSAQTTWDVLFGIVLPLGCLLGDQILFGKDNPVFEGSVFGQWRLLCYGFILTEVLLLGLWLLLRRRTTRSAAYFAGPLLAGWIFSLVLALALFPFSLIGLLVVIGVLGFSPWLTTFAFYRNWKMARTLSGGRRRFWMSVAGIIFALTPALALQSWGDRLARRLIESPQSSRRVEQAARFPLFPADRLVSAWRRERDPERKIALSRAHERLTGKPIEEVD